MLKRVWLWLSNPDNQRTASFVGGALAVLVSGLWQLYIWMPAPQPAGSTPGVEADARTAQSHTATTWGAGVAVVQTGDGQVTITNTAAVSEEKFEQLAAELGIARGALKSFFAALQREQVAPEDLDNELREIAKRYKDLQGKLDAYVKSESAAAALKQEVREAFNAGDLSRAEVLLTEAGDRDIAAAKEMAAKAKEGMLAAASARALAGELKITEMAYREAAEYYRQAADLVFGYEPLAAAGYLGQEGVALLEAGQQQQAREPLEQALSIRERGLPPEDPRIADSLDDLASWNRALGNYLAAEPLYRRALAIREKVLNADDPSIAESLNSLALLYGRQGRYDDAETLLQRVLAMRERLFGPESPNVAASLNNLALLYKERGRFSAAESLFRRALSNLEKSVGEDHPAVAANLNNLGLVYHAQGRFQDAEPLYRRALAIREKTLGPEHPDVAQSLNNMADLYRGEKNYEQAERYSRRALAILEKAFVSDHPDVATCLNNLAASLYAQRRYNEAEPLYVRALHIREKSLGADHPDVATSVNNLAALYRAERRYDEAEPLYLRALAIRRNVLGEDHPDVVASRGNLSGLYRMQGRKVEAEAVEERNR